MTATITPDRTPTYGTDTGPVRQARWTRLGIALGYTDTEGKRGEIRAALVAATWVDPHRHPIAELSTDPARHVIAAVLFGRAWALDRVAVVDLPGDELGRERRVIGLQLVTGERHVLLDVDYEAAHVLHETTVPAEVLG